MKTFWKIVIVVLFVLVLWMAFGKPWPSGLSTDRDRILAEVNAGSRDNGDSEDDYIVVYQSPELNEEENISESDTSVPCITKANALGFPSNLVDYVCNGTYGAGANGPLPSSIKVEFGTITIDNATAVWILHNFIVPNYANYAFEYAGTEQNLLEAPFLNGKTECFDPATGLRTEICNVCFDTTSPGCELEIDFFN